MFKTFALSSQTQATQDKAPFLMKHNLLNHPTLTIESLAKIIPEIPEYQVMYSKGLRDLGVNFDRAHVEHANGLSLQETIDNMMNSDSYIAVKNPEVHPAFKEIFADLIKDVASLMKSQGLDENVYEPRLWLFIASPNAMTPFHFDRYSNFLMQLRGSKEIAVFPPMHEEVISAENCESYIDQVPQVAPWCESKDQYAQKFKFVPGDMLHIPFVSGHYVKNGPEDVSISLSFFFHNKYTMEKTKAYQVNHRLRKKMKALGMVPTPVGQSNRLDKLKATIHPVTTLVGRSLGFAKKLVRA